MPFNRALETVLDRLAATDQPVLLDWYTVEQWPEGALKQLLEIGLLVKTAQAESIECRECGSNICYMDVEWGSLDRAFVVCDDSEMQDQMGVINIPLDHLKQWKTNAKLLAKVISDLLELDYQPDRKKQPANIKLGWLVSKQGRRTVSLNVHPLQLEVNQRNAPIKDLLYFNDNELLLDRSRINEMLLASPLQQSKTYTPSTSRREDVKRETEAKHQDWIDAYYRLKRKHPDKTKPWICKEIAKLDIAQGADDSTIYRKLNGIK
jgi:hypothetical protein